MSSNNIGGLNRKGGWKREQRQIGNVLKRHADLTARYVAEGMDQAAASRRAFKEVTAR